MFEMIHMYTEPTGPASGGAGGIILWDGGVVLCGFKLWTTNSKWYGLSSLKDVSNLTSKIGYAPSCNL